MTVLGALAAGVAAAVACLALFGFEIRASAPARIDRRALAATLVLGAAGVALASLAGAPLLGLAAGALPLWWRWRQRARDRGLAESSIVPTIETLVGASRAGLVLPEALALGRGAARGELAERIAAALSRLRFGASTADAIAEARPGASARIGSLLDDLELCARSRLGAEHVAAFLEDVLSARRFERELASDVHSRTAGQRFQVWLLAAVVPTLALYLAAMSPTLAEQLASPFGRMVLIPAGALFEIGGVLASRRVLSWACD